MGRVKEKGVRVRKEAAKIEMEAGRERERERDLRGQQLLSLLSSQKEAELQNEDHLCST